MAIQDTLDQLKGFDFNDLDVSNIGSWPAPVKFIILALTLALVLGGGYWGYLTGIQERLAKAEARERSLRAEYEDKAGQAANLDAYLRQKEEMENTFGALLKQLPSDTEVPGLVEDITRTAIDNELTIESIDLLSEIRTEFYVELPMQVVVEGSFHKIGSFVSGVAALPRIVTLHDFDIKPESSDQHLRMSITAKTYRYLGEDE